MGFRWRINLGIARLNVTKDGMGVSTGVPGVRTGVGPKGGRWTAYSVPGTGISYMQRHGQRQSGATATPPKWKSVVASTIVIGVVIAAVWALTRQISPEPVTLSEASASSAPITADDVRVIDGDTIRVHHQKPDIRLVGFNAPETRRAQCQAERALGDKATARLRDLVRSSKLDFEFVACACPPGKEGTPSCNYGRRCGTLKANGRDVGAILISENLAVPFVCGQTRCPPTPKPWCK